MNLTAEDKTAVIKMISGAIRTVDSLAYTDALYSYWAGYRKALEDVKEAIEQGDEEI